MGSRYDGESRGIMHMEHAQIADYLLRAASPDDQAQIYHLKAQSVRPYVDKIWGWDEVYQQQDFARD